MNDKQKNIALVIGFVLLFIISYVFSIQKTIDVKKSAKSLYKEKELLENASQRIFLLQQENKYLDSILKAKEISIENSFQQTLLQKLNSFQAKVPIDIIAFSEPHTIEENSTLLKTYSFEIKGTFNALLQLLNTLEKQQLGKLVSVKFEKKKNYRRNRDELIGHYFIQKRTQRE
ncbi:hypothetical protein [Polaribacter porphyrae]|uniref:General secretion pathway protein n=1 Tax=Polaribacter porphyrae TaxID=1137780 RepID=A0A2S7WSJ2_9FLAO|nr:hypothetical protein [Polaribacter porphyrae]PQJ80292.1 hypothetical protein BTO18_14380 [Polaribacter porphyrae]